MFLNGKGGTGYNKIIPNARLKLEIPGSLGPSRPR